MSEVGVIPYHGDGPEKQQGEAVAWLREQITARLETARALCLGECGHWVVIRNDDFDWTVFSKRDAGLTGADAVADTWREDVATYLAANDPQQVTEDCEAQLAILDRCAIPVMTGVARDVVRYVASAYRHREGYAQHWGNGADIH